MQGDSDVVVDEDLTALRAKTREVEQVGSQVDEKLTLCSDTKEQVSRLGRYDDVTFQANKSKTPEQLREMIRAEEKLLEPYKRKNPHSGDWYDKYLRKYEDL